MSPLQRSSLCRQPATPGIHSRALARNFLRFGARRVLVRLHAVHTNAHLEGFEDYLPTWARGPQR